MSSYRDGNVLDALHPIRLVVTYTPCRDVMRVLTRVELMQVPLPLYLPNCYLNKPLLFVELAVSGF